MIEATKRPEVSVVIVNWNGGDIVLDCLRSLFTCPPTASWEVILVDNASSDGSPDRIRSELPSTRVIGNQANRGLAKANNQGIVASTAPFVLISNPDVIYRAGAVDALVAVMERRPRAALVVASLRFPDGSQQTSAGSLPTLSEAVLGRRFARRRGSTPASQGFWWDGWDHLQERAIDRGAEACYLVRRQAMAEVGLQDERFFLDWEGIDWTERMTSAGWEVWFCPDAEVTHLGGTAIRRAPWRWVVSTHLGMYRYFAARRPGPVRPLLAGMIGLRGAVKMAALIGRVPLYDRAHQSRTSR